MSRITKTALLLLMLVSVATSSELPRLALDKPDNPGPVLIGFGATGGGAVDYDDFTVGWTGSIIFRPAQASNFINQLFYWNTGLVMHGDYRPCSSNRRLLSADLLLRYYLSDVSDSLILFIEAGPGMAHITYPVFSESENGSLVEIKGTNRYYTALTGGGFEYALNPKFMLYSTLHWRYFNRNNRDYSGWNFTAGLAVPIPW
jgi:hypothetical protein